MTDILLLARTHLLTAFRERITLFWSLIFPVFLFVILTIIFGRIGQEGEINFSVSLVDMDVEAAEEGGFAAMVEELFENVGTTEIEGKEPLFTLSRPKEGDDPQVFLEDEQQALRRGRRAAVIVIPKGFSERLGLQMASTSEETRPAVALTVYYSQGNAASEMAASIIEQILAGVDREILKRSGRFREGAAVPSETVWVGGDRLEVRYVDFLLPGVILMGFFTNSLFGIPGAILFSRDQKVLRRYWVTPLVVPRFLAGLSLGHLSLCLLQFFLLFLLGRYGFNATISFAGIVPAFFLVLAATTFMAFGFLIASVAKTANAGMAIANILNMPMMFISGLFFLVSGLPAALKAIVYVNPVSYLADGVRASVGVESGLFSMPLLVGVPLAWIVVSSAVASWRLRLDVER